MKNNEYDNMLKYYIFGALFQTIWCIVIVAFTVFLIYYFKTAYCLFAVLLILVKPYQKLEWKYTKKTEESDTNT